MVQSLLMIVGLLPVLTSGPDPASQSEPIARRVVQLMEQHKLESVAVRESESADRFAAVLRTSGQLLLVSSRYAAPAYIREYLIKDEPKGAYVTLASSGEREHKLFIQDMGADGLQLRAIKGSPFDIIYREVTDRTSFDGDWRQQKLSEAEYVGRFTAADQQYAALLALIVEEINRRFQQ